MSHTENISKLEQFIKMMTGHFDNQEQFQKMKEAGEIYPYAEHVNTPCNNKIQDLPADFYGIFIVEESYYQSQGKRHSSPHLFLLTEQDDGIMLSSYEIPEGEDKKTFSYETMKKCKIQCIEKVRKIYSGFVSRKGWYMGRRQCKPVFAGNDISVMGEIF